MMAATSFTFLERRTFGASADISATPSNSGQFTRKSTGRAGFDAPKRLLIAGSKASKRWPGWAAIAFDHRQRWA
jgi:hypothetical protein